MVRPKRETRQLTVLPSLPWAPPIPKRYIQETGVCLVGQLSLIGGDGRGRLGSQKWCSLETLVLHSPPYMFIICTVRWNDRRNGRKHYYRGLGKRTESLITEVGDKSLENSVRIVPNLLSKHDLDEARLVHRFHNGFPVYLRRRSMGGW